MVHQHLFDVDTDRLSLVLERRLKAFTSITLLPEIESVKITRPTKEQFLTALHSNGLLPLEKGHISIKPKGSAALLSLDVRMPYHGIFVTQTQDEYGLVINHRNTLWTWCPWMSEGIHARLVHGNTHTNKIDFRIGCGTDRYVSLPIRKQNGEPYEDDEFYRHLKGPRLYFLIQDHDRLPADICQLILKGANGLPLLPHPKAAHAAGTWLALREHALTMLSKGKPSDDFDNISESVLINYTYWLAGRVIGGIFKTLTAVPKTDLESDGRAKTPEEKQAEKFSQTFKAIHAARQRSATDNWSLLLKSRRILSEGLFPFNKLRTRGMLHSFRPTNPIEAISQLTQVKRYGMSAATIEHLPPVYHQNHRSFFGRLCPVETPESESLGISLHLAKEATQDEFGRLVPCPIESHGLGWAASLIPFFEHNDAVRNMMGAKNLKQALPIARRQAPSVSTGEESDILEALEPLAEAAIIPNMHGTPGQLAAGVDLLVAYMPFDGLNFEDAIVANRRLVEDHILDFTKIEKLLVRIGPGYDGTRPVPHVMADPGPDDHIDQITGLAKAGTQLRRGTLLAKLWHTTAKEDRLIHYSDLEAAELVSIELDCDPAFGGLLTCVIRKLYAVGVGDKLMGRHGNKGVISALLPDNEMPQLPNDEKLPMGLRGRAVDLVLNPHGVISRMNVGQLMETHLGWLMHVLGPKEKNAIQLDSGAFKGQFPGQTAHLSGLLAQSGLDAAGKIVLKLPNNKVTEQAVVVGYQHIVRLRHIPTLKSQARGHSSSAQYDIRTGQAAHGRRIGGGQRAGEMEFWALAAHQAHALISEMLQKKADPRTFNKAAKQEADPSTWQAIRDHLFAIGIEATHQNGSVTFGWADLSVAPWSAGVVTDDKDTIQGSMSVFQCPDCDYQPVDRALFHDADGSVRLKEVLLALGWKCPVMPEPKSWKPGSPDIKGHRTFKGTWKLQSLKGHGSRTVPVECTQLKSGISITMKIAQGAGKSDIILAARGRPPGQGSKGKKTKLGFTADGIARKDENPNLLPIDELVMSCAKTHLSVELRPVPGRSIGASRPTKAGLQSETIFGRLTPSERWTRQETWGHIELPEPVPYPRFLFDERSENDQISIPEIRFVPILPLCHRVRPTGNKAGNQPDEISEAYRKLIGLCRSAASYDKTIQKQKEKYTQSLKEITWAVEAVFTACLAALNGPIPKKGLIRRHGLGRRVNCSGRLVIVPDPQLRPSQCKVPVHILWELMREDVAAWLKESTILSSDPKSGWLSLADAFAQLEEGDTKHGDSLSDRQERKLDTLLHQLLDYKTAEELHAKALSSGKLEALCLATLDAYLKAHPKKLILLNRQPSLHKYSVMAFRPTPTPIENGEVLRLPPLICGAFAADFDGDEMALHWPISDAAHEDAHKLLFCNNLISESNGQPIAHYAQDIVLGIYLLKTRQKESVLFEFLPDHGTATTCCRDTIETKPCWNETVGLELIKHVCTSHPIEAEEAIWKIANAGFASATEAGISFGLFDLLAARPDASTLNSIVQDLDKSIKTKPVLSAEAMRDADKSISTAVHDHLQALIKGADTLGKGLAFIALSGARGGKQVKQLVAMRCILSPGAHGFSSTPEEFFFRHSLVSPCDRETYYRTVYNSRSSMCDKKLGTGKAGWITRELVGALWGISIARKVDCGATGTRHPAGCRLKTQICQTCYGPPTMPSALYVQEGSGLYSPGYPAGLMAAQAIGERGTQLSMQSFHTGQSAFTPDRIRVLFNTPAFFDIAMFHEKTPFDWLNDAPDPVKKALDELYDMIPDMRAIHFRSSSISDAECERLDKRDTEIQHALETDMHLKARAELALCKVFLVVVTSIDAYRHVLPRHIEILWRVINGSIEKTLTDVPTELPPLAALGFTPIKKALLKNASRGLTDNLQHPASRIIIGLY